MKILAIGDFHGTFPNKFYNIIDNEKVDFVISLGDYPPFHYRKLWFKHCYGKEVELWEIIGKKKYKGFVLEDLRRAEISLKKLNAVKVPVFTVLGNIDWPVPDDIIDFPAKINKTQPNYDKKEKVAKLLKKYKNIKRFDYSYVKFGDYVLIGMRGHSAPGRTRSKAFRKHKKILDKLFKKFSKENKENKIIFVSHNIANNTRLDKISKETLKKIKELHEGKRTKKLTRHYGSKMARRIIDKYSPLLHLGGHIHEGRGKQKIGKTWLVNPGSAHENQAAVIEIHEGKVKKIKLIR